MGNMLVCLKPQETYQTYQHFLGLRGDPRTSPTARYFRRRLMLATAQVGGIRIMTNEISPDFSSTEYSLFEAKRVQLQ
jgi:hypothetical protein